MTGRKSMLLTKTLFVILHTVTQSWSQTPPPFASQRDFIATPPTSNTWRFPGSPAFLGSPQNFGNNIPRNPTQPNFQRPRSMLGVPNPFPNMPLGSGIRTPQFGPVLPVQNIPSAGMAPRLDTRSRSDFSSFAAASNTGTIDTRDPVLGRDPGVLRANNNINQGGLQSSFQTNNIFGDWNAPPTFSNNLPNPNSFGNNAPFQSNDIRNFADITQQWNTNSAGVNNNPIPNTVNGGSFLDQSSNSSSAPLAFESAFPGFPKVTINDFGRDSWHDFLKQLLDRHHPNIPPLARTSDPSMEPIPRRISDLPAGVSPIYIRNSRGTPAYVPFSLPNREMNILVPFDRQTRRLVYPYLPLYIPYAGFTVDNSGRQFVMYLPFQPDRFRTSREGAPIAVPQENSDGLFPNYVDFRPRVTSSAL